MITFNRPSSFSLTKGRTIGLLAVLGVLGLQGVTPIAELRSARADVAYTPEQYGDAYWPFEKMADAAAGTAGFSPEARQSVKWSTAILNAYTGDEGWLAEAPAVPVQGSPAGFQNRPAGGSQRRVASQATKDFILSLRFDRAQTIYDADAVWRRVMSGALAGLLHAREHNDVAAALNVLGAALYASQNFYTHTNWVEDPSRRVTYFEMLGNDRQKVPLSSNAVKPNPEAARVLAERQCRQTLQVLEYAMNKAGAGEFWKKVKTDGVSQADRERQFEEFGRMPHAFLSAWNNPASAGETWLRVRLKTSKEANSGTNARMVLKAGGRETVMDWLPTVSNVGSPYDDFEAGNDDAYWVGPFATPPTEIQISNEAMDGRATIPLMPAFVIWNALVLVLKPLDMVFSNPPDFVQNGESRWSVPDLKVLPNGAQPFAVDLDGKDEGHYKVHGTIERTGEDSTYYYARIRLNRLDCIMESKIDGLSASDEPL